ANMSHELRTPLNSSIILAKLLKDNPDEDLTKEQVEIAETIHGAGNDLLLLINDILDLSKVESGMLEVQPEQTAVSGLIETLERTFQPVAREKQLRFLVKTDPGAPETIVTDPRRVEQILKNLVSNALKFTAKGDVEVQVAKSEQGIAFRVKDSGIGIAPANQAAIFEAFRQADGTTSRKYGGTGLGLSISKNLAEILGGSIDVDSALGQGSTFTLWLPLEISGPVEIKPPALASIPASAHEPVRKPTPMKASDHPAPGPVRPKNSPPLIDDDRALMKPGQPKTLLIVEDELQYAKIIFQAAKEKKFLTAVAADTDEGFKLAKSLRPSAILLDIRLPDGSGLSLLDRLKYDPDTRHILVHGMSVADYSREALHMGAAGFALKASDLDEIRRTLSMLEEKTRSRSRRVLLVEDDSVQRASVEKLIGAKGVEIVAVENGADALTALHNSLFDCMIIDLKLPDMTGFELLDKISMQKGSAIPPVIVYTGKDLSRAEEQNLYRHSRTIIIKGARSPERLLDEVTLFLHQAEADLTPEHQKMLRASRNRERAFDGRTILLVDDDVRNIFALSSALELKGANVKIARNGREAVDKVLKDDSIDIV
ncbi:MAG: response regulator, partial [Proteobacteria bacterium]